ncbi:hypothetical protein SDJN03_18420, partial [Cucurbita argyrosperma subsp. sororia]
MSMPSSMVAGEPLVMAYASSSMLSATKAASSAGIVPYRLENIEGEERVSIRRLITASRVRCVDGHMLNLVPSGLAGERKGREKGKKTQRLWSGSEAFGTFLLLDMNTWNGLILRCSFICLLPSLVAWLGSFTVLVLASPLMSPERRSSSSSKATAMNGSLKNRMEREAEGKRRVGLSVGQ